MVGIWEVVRHQFLMPYISMDLGNYLTPVLVFLVSLVLLVPLFSLMERNQRELEQERALKEAMKAREGLAKELHDGMAQSLFLLSVKIDRLEANRKNGEVSEESVNQIKKTVHEVNRYVRQAIANLKIPVSEQSSFSLEQSVKDQLAQMANEIMIEARSIGAWKMMRSPLRKNQNCYPVSVKRSLMFVSIHEPGWFQLLALAMRRAGE